MPKTGNIFDLLDLLRKKPIDSTQIVQHLRISLPTVYRYVRELRTLGFQIDVIQKQYTLIAEPDRSPEQIRTLYQRSVIPINPDIVRKIRNAIKFALPATLRYKKPTAKSYRDYTVDILDFIMIDHRYYVVARDRQDEVLKEFRVDRIQSVITGHSRHHTQKHHPFAIKFLLNKRFSAYYDDQFPGANIQKQLDGTLEVTLHVHSLFRAHMLLFPFLESITLLEPPELKTQLIDSLKNILAKYE